MTSGYISAASFAQRQLRYLDILRPGSSEYAVPLIVEITGSVDLAALRGAFQAVIQRHDVLRAALPLIDGAPALAVSDDLAIELPLLHADAATPDDWHRELAGVVTRMAARPFDLQGGPLLTAALVRAADASATGCAMALAVVFHHAIADGASLPLFVNDLAAAYDASLRGSAPQWPELPLQYPDFADWEQERFGAPDAPALEPALHYWRQALQDVPALLDLPLDRTRGATRPAGATVRLELPDAVGKELARIARERGATPFIAFLAVFFAVLHRWSGLDDLVVTVPVSKRSRPELAPLIGLLVDTLPMRLECTPATSYGTLLDNVQQVFRDGMRHRDAPFQRIVQAIDIERHNGVVPLMQVLFGGLEPAQAPVVASDGCRFAVADDQMEQAAKSDLSVVYRQSAERLELWCRYDPALFDRASMENLLGWFGNVAAAVARDPDQAIGSLPLIGEEDGRRLLARFNPTLRPCPSGSSVIARFDDVARQYPQNTALDENGQATNYAALAEQSARLAAALAMKGLGAGDTVVLVLPVSGQLISLILAILRIGAIYVPLDPAHPHAHRLRLAASVGASAVIVPDDGCEDYGGIHILDARALSAQATALAAHAGDMPAAADAAYVMFTSGSTGQPKGVAIPHRAILRLVLDTNFADFGPDTRAAVYSNPSFDASTVELWAPLLNGGAAVVVARDDMLDTGRLRRMLAERRINFLWITAGLFHEVAGIDPSVFAGKRLVMTGGDVVNPDAARAVLAAGEGSGLRLLNGYGPTENTTFSTTFDIAGLDPDSLSVPIGKPVANSTVYILDTFGQPLPVGVIGEIHVGGEGVANGYVGDPQRTASAFLPDPYSGLDGARMYRSGDHGRWRADGSILFAGRSDDQIKLRGFRIELNEIAVALGRHPALRAVHVAAPRLAGGERRIAAYVQPHTAPAPTAAELRGFLEPLLPAHMLPHAYVAVDTFALNLNGKVDRKALPPIQDHHYDHAAQSVAPRTDAEHALHAIWQELLETTQFGVTDNFFHMGGDSILAIRMAAQATATGLPITPADVFRLQTIERLADAAATAQPRPRRMAADRVFPVELAPAATHAQKRPFLLASLVLPRRTTLVELALIIQSLAERHEALRLRWVQDEQASRLEIMAYVARLPIRTVEAPHLADAGLDDWVAEYADRLGRGLDTATGVLIATTLIERGASAPQIAVLALHRAAADACTLALIAAELEAMLNGGYASLPPPENSAAYGDWLEWLENYANQQAAGEAFAFLESPAMRAAAAPASPPAQEPRIVAECRLPREAADALLHHAAQQLFVTPLDILASAFSAALPPTQETGTVLIEVLDGQRLLPSGAPRTDTLPGNLDNVLPLLAPADTLPMTERLSAIKLARQAVQAMAPAYRTLRQTFDLPAPALGLAWLPGGAGSSALRLHSLPSFGPAVQGMLLADIVDGQLRLAWAGTEPAGGAAQLLERAAQALRAIAGLPGEGVRALHTPADFPLAGLSMAELDQILNTASDILDIYPLSPMQEAMLVHTLAATDSLVNFEQSCVRIRGRLDHEAFRHAWATVLERHDVLRTSFHWRGLARPLQAVHRSVPLPFTTEAWPAFDPARLEAFLAEDRARGFDLEQAPLLRVTLIQVAPDEAYFVSSFHHLLVDGWCLSRLEREVRAAYQTYRSRPPLFDEPAPYRAYIAWLAQADQARSQRYFAELLHKLPPQRRLFAPAAGPAAAFKTARHTLDRTSSRALTAFARRRGLTLAAILHFAWGVWLSARLGRSDVVFGTTVSGRPAGLPEVDRIIGLFINNLPVRLRLEAHDNPSERLATMQTQLGDLQDHAHLSPTAVAAAAGVRSGTLFDTLVVVENLMSGTSAWDGAEGLTVESVHSRLKTAYDLTFIAMPGDSIALSLVQPDDGRVLEDGDAVLQALAGILRALPEAAQGCIADLPRPVPREPASGPAALPASPLRFATRPRSTLEAAIAGALADISQDGADCAVDLDADFWRLGVNSLDLLRLAAKLEQSLGRPVPISLLLEHRSVTALAQAVESGQRWTPIVPMSGTGAPTAQGQQPEPFVCVHPVAGDVSVFLDLAQAMPATIPFWAIQAEGLEPGQEPLASIEAMAQANLQALTERGMARPRWIGGYSLGGLIAFEMARQLHERGTPPERVIIIDTPAPLERISILDPDPDRAHAQWLVRMAEVRARFQNIAPVLGFDELLAVPAEERCTVAARQLHAARLLPPTANAAWLERAHRSSLAQYRAYLAYAPAPVPEQKLPLAVIRAAAPKASDLGEHENRRLEMEDLGWGAFTHAAIDTYAVVGDHVTILAPDTAPAVAQAIADILASNGRP